MDSSSAEGVRQKTGAKLMMKSIPKLLFLLMALTMTQLSCVAAPEDDTSANQPQDPGADQDDGSNGGMGGEEGNEGDDESPNGDEDSNEDNAVAVVEGSFRIHADDLTTPAGTNILGISSNFAWPKALEMYGEAGGRGGLYRKFINMFAEGHNLGRDILAAKEAGMRSMITIHGTPYDLATNFEGEELAPHFPIYARSMPSDLNEYSNRVVDRIRLMELNYGVIPDYLEVWGEPDIQHYWSGTLEDYLELYEALSTKVRQNYPSIKIGGMGVATWRSKMGGDQPALLSLAERAKERGLPLAFISWHNYTTSSELLRSKWCETARAKLDELEFNQTELMMTEWNLHDATQGATVRHDRSNSAASFAGFMTTAIQTGIDNAVFFKLQDDPSDDFTGGSVGAITHRGVKKPAFRVMEEFIPMMQESRARTERYEDEYSLQVLSTRSGNRLRIVLSNAVQDVEWSFASACRDKGYLAGVLWKMYKTAVEEEGHEAPGQASLMAAGMTEEEATFTQDLQAHLRQVADWNKSSRPVEIEINASGNVQVSRVVRFDSEHNSPADHLDALRPHLEDAERLARSIAHIKTVEEINLMGYSVTVEELDSYEGSLEALSNRVGMTHEEKRHISRYQNEATFEARLESETLLNSLPETALHIESASEAGVSLSGNRLLLDIEPQAVTVIDIQLN